MTKRLVDIDDELLERAQAASGARTIKGTVEAGLQRLVDQELIERHIAWLRSGRGPDVRQIEAARAPRMAPSG